MTGLTLKMPRGQTRSIFKRPDMKPGCIGASFLNISGAVLLCSLVSVGIRVLAYKTGK
jgi:hypothetical protein